MPPARYPRATERRRRLRLALAAAASAAVVVIVVIVVLVDRVAAASLSGAPPARDAPRPGPAGCFTTTRRRPPQYSARATAGNGQVLFAKSPGGAIATATRVAALAPMIDHAVAGTNIPATALEGLVFLESAGLPDAAVADDPANAAGLTQILPSTATSLLHMHVDVAASRRLLAEIAQAHSRRQAALAAAPAAGRRPAL